jgi:hypothetical protein
MARFEKGNQAARKARGTPKKPHIAHLLEQFAPDVVAVVRDMLASADLQERWTAAREVMPYLWGKKSAVTVSQEAEKPSLADYLANKQPEPPLYSPQTADETTGKETLQ